MLVAFIELPFRGDAGGEREVDVKIYMSCTLAHTRTCHMLYEPSMLSPTCIIRFRNSLLLTAIPLHYQVEKYDEVAQRAYTFGRGMGRRPIPLPWYGPKAHTIGSSIPSEQREACTFTMVKLHDPYQW